MRVFFYSLPQNIDSARKIQEKLNLSGYDTRIFDNDSQFFERIMSKTDLPDLIVYDYFLFNHNVFNIYDYMKTKNTVIPLVFFNEPTIRYSSTHYFWKNVLDVIYTKKYFCWEKFQEPLKLISEIIDKDRNPITETNKEFSLEKINSKNSPDNTFLTELKGNSLILFNSLKDNLNRTVNLLELRTLLQKNDAPCKESTVFCMISRLRKIMENTGFRDYEIIKNQQGYMMVERKFN